MRNYAIYNMISNMLHIVWKTPTAFFIQKQTRLCQNNMLKLKNVLILIENYDVF